MNNLNLMGNLKYFLFLILPALIILNISNNKSYFYESVSYDPDYCYLLNGLNLASFHLVIGHTDHPGTPVQLISALIIRTTYFLRITDHDLVTDVLTFPEYYLKIIATTFSIINLTFLILFGIILYRLTNDLFYGLLFQAIPFYSTTVLKDSFYHDSPEPLLFLLIIILLFAFVLHEYYNKLQKQIRLNFSGSAKIKCIEIDLFLIILSILAGLLLATKINSFPIILFLILFINKFKNKIIFSVLTLLSFVLVTLPIIDQYTLFFDWVFRLFIHSGRYGAGSPDIVNINSFFTNLNLIIKHEPIFITTILISILFLLLNYKSSSDRKKIRLLLLITFIQILSIIVISKQFAFRYLIPILPTIFINIFIFLHISKTTNRNKHIIILFFLAACYFQIILQRLSKPSVTHEKVENHKQNIYSYGCESKIYALHFGNEYSKRMFSKNLKKIYGEQFFYNIWGKKFTNWDTEISLESLKMKRKDWILYINDYRVTKFKPGFKLARISEEKYLIE